MVLSRFNLAFCDVTHLGSNPLDPAATLNKSKFLTSLGNSL